MCDWIAGLGSLTPAATASHPELQALEGDPIRDDPLCLKEVSERAAHTLEEAGLRTSTKSRFCSRLVPLQRQKVVSPCHRTGRHLDWPCLSLSASGGKVPRRLQEGIFGATE